MMGRSEESKTDRTEVQNTEKRVRDNKTADRREAESVGNAKESTVER